MVSVLATSAVDRGFEPGHVKDYKIGLFSTKHGALKSYGSLRLAQNKDNVFEWSNICIHGLLFQ